MGAPAWFLLLTGDDAPDVPVFTGDLFTQFCAWFRSEPRLQVLFPGGCYNEQAAPRSVYPFLTVEEIEPQDPASEEDWEAVIRATVWTRESPSGDDTAKQIGWTLCQLLDDPSKPTFRWWPWMEAGHLTMGRPTLTREGIGPNNTVVWSWTCDLKYFIVLDPAYG